LEKIEKAQSVLKHFKESYETHKDKLKDYFKEEEPKEWEFAAPLVFARLDKFMERIEIVLVSFYIYGMFRNGATN
jgi:dynein heavy chain